MTLTSHRTTTRPYRYALVYEDGSAVRSIRGLFELTFSEFDFARGIGMSRATAEKPVYVVDGLTGVRYDLEGNQLL